MDKWARDITRLVYNWQVNRRQPQLATKHLKRLVFNREIDG